MSVTRLQRVLRVCNFGPIPVKYAEALDLQERLAELCKQKQAPDTLLQLQVCGNFRSMPLHVKKLYVAGLSGLCAQLPSVDTGAHD